MPETPKTIAAQRADLLRQVVFDRPSHVDTDDRQLFSAEIGLTVHAFMADTYAAALAEVAPERAEEIAAELAEYLDDGALPEYAWDRAEELGHNPQKWRDDYLAAKNAPNSPASKLHRELMALRGAVRAAKAVAKHGDMSVQARAELNEALTD